MLTNLLKWLKPEITQETQKTVLLKHALENNDIDIDENDFVLFDKGIAGYGVYGQRQEALILDYTNTDAQVAYVIKGTRKTRWIPIYSITSNLGCDYKSIEEQIAIGLVDPKPQRANKPLLSGTYINEVNEDDYALVEIEKVNGAYYIHKVNDARCVPITPDHEYNLHEFSSPEEGTYILDPGLYIRTDKRLFEVIPFKGSCWIRQLDDCMLMELDEHEALKLTRIETDEPTPGFYILNNDELSDEDPVGNQEYDPHLEPYKVPEPTNNTENQPGFTPRQNPTKISPLDLVGYDDILDPIGYDDLNPGNHNTPEDNPTDPI